MSLEQRRRRGKAPVDGVASPLELERRCGSRLRQVRRADLLLGVHDVMYLAEAEFGLRVSFSRVGEIQLAVGGPATECVDRATGEVVRVS